MRDAPTADLTPAERERLARIPWYWIARGLGFHDSAIIARLMFARWYVEQGRLGADDQAPRAA